MIAKHVDHHGLHRQYTEIDGDRSLLDNGYLDSDLIELVDIKNNLSADVLDDLKKVFGSGAKDSTTGVNMVSLDRMNAI